MHRGGCRWCSRAGSKRPALGGRSQSEKHRRPQRSDRKPREQQRSSPHPQTNLALERTEASSKKCRTATARRPTNKGSSQTKVLLAPERKKSLRGLSRFCGLSAFPLSLHHTRITVFVSGAEFRSAPERQIRGLLHRYRGFRVGLVTYINPISLGESLTLPPQKTYLK